MANFMLSVLTTKQKQLDKMVTCILIQGRIIIKPCESWNAKHRKIASFYEKQKSLEIQVNTWLVLKVHALL